MYPASGTAGQPAQQAQPAQRPWDSNTQQPYRPDQGYPQLAPVSTTYPPRTDLQPATAHPARPDRPEMAAIHQPTHQYYQAPHPGPYLPGPSNLYPPHPDQYRQQPQQPQPQPTVTQSAPRQRTAIACKYCRRRKIRCSGFENSEDGRCTNCIRFSQECVFTPVSAQTQAFVPAQALYGRGRGGPPGPPQQLYGPYGNRLPPQHDPYGHPPPGHPGYTLPSPGAYPPHGQPYPYPPQYYDPTQAAGTGRGRGEQQPIAGQPLHAISASHPGQQRDQQGQAQLGTGYPDPAHYPPPGNSPSMANGSYPVHPHGPAYYGGPQGPHHQSPQGSAYSYDPSRESQSPHGPPSGAYQYAPGQGPPPSQAGQTPSVDAPRTSPPGGSGSDRGRSDMSINNIVDSENGGSTSGGERSAADRSMVSALNRPTKRETTR